MDIMIKDVRNGMKNMSLNVIILEVGTAIPIKEREVRTLKVADTSGCINMSLWDEPGRCLVPGDIIRLTKAHVNVFRNCLTLYPGKAGDIEKLGEFCMVFNEQLNMSEPNMTFEASQNMNNGGPAGLGPMGNSNNGNKGPTGPKQQSGKPQQRPQEQQQQHHQQGKKMNNKSSKGVIKGIGRTERR